MNKVTLKEALSLHMRAFKLLCKHNRGIFLSIFLYCLTSAVTPYVGIYFSAQIINELAGARNTEALWKLVLLTVAVTGVMSLLTAVFMRLKNSATDWGYNICADQKVLAEKMLDMDFCIADEQRTHDLLSQIQQNRNWSGWGFLHIPESFEKFIKAVISVIGALVLTVSLFTLPVPESAGAFTALNNPLFAVLMVVVMLAITLIIPHLSNKANEYFVKYSESAKLANRIFTFFGYRVTNQRDRALDVRMYNQQDLCGYYMSSSKIFTPDSLIAKWSRGPMGLLYIVSTALSCLLTGVVYIFVCLKAWAGAFGVGSVTQYIAAITAMYRGIGDIFGFFGELKNNAAFLRVNFEYLDTPNRMYKGSLTTEKRSDRQYDVEFRDVSFKYPGSQTYALRHVSIKFKVGERLAVVGMNGSGKTTFIKLLCRLYDPDEGEILLNGIDIRKYDYADYMNIFSVVFQDFKLLSFPLGQNVASSVKYDKDRVISCLKKAGFGKRLSEMENGVDTMLYRDIDEKGVNVSGGEAQKIAIARALYKDAPFIVLDEPTAALDPIAEAEVYSKFNEIVTDKTAIYISHRLSSCRFCDEIAVFDDGQIVQYGTHDALLADENGKYRELWYAQAQYYTE